MKETFGMRNLANFKPAHEQLLSTPAVHKTTCTIGHDAHATCTCNLRPPETEGDGVAVAVAVLVVERGVAGLIAPTTTTRTPAAAAAVAPGLWCCSAPSYCSCEATSLGPRLCTLSCSSCCRPQHNGCHKMGADNRSHWNTWTASHHCQAMYFKKSKVGHEFVFIMTGNCV